MSDRVSGPFKGPRQEPGCSSDRLTSEYVGFRTPGNPERTEPQACDNPICRTASGELLKRIEALENALLLANRLADYDHLTGLANRRLLETRFNLSAALAKRHGKQLAVLFLDMDEFKQINDRFGHEAGDRLLQQVGERLSAAVRSVDTVCRYGGDEFVVLFTEINGLENARKAVSGIMESLAEPFEARGVGVAVKISHGLGTFPDDGDDLSAVIEYADQEMYRNKGGGALAMPLMVAESQ